MIVRNRAFYMVLDTLMVIFSYCDIASQRGRPSGNYAVRTVVPVCSGDMCILSCHPVLSGKEATDETE